MLKVPRYQDIKVLELVIHPDNSHEIILILDHLKHKNLEMFTLSGTNMGVNVDTERLATVVINTKVVHLCNREDQGNSPYLHSFGTEQLEAILVKLNEPGTRLQHLKMETDDKRRKFVKLEPEIVAKGINSLESFKISHWHEIEKTRPCQFTKDQLKALFLQIPLGTNLVKLDLAQEALSEVEPEIVTQGLLKIEYINIQGLSVEQIVHFFKALSKGDHQVKYLELRRYKGTLKDADALERVSTTIIAEAVKTLKSFTVDYSLTKSQVQQIFDDLIFDNSQLSFFDPKIEMEFPILSAIHMNAVMGKLRFVCPTYQRLYRRLVIRLNSILRKDPNFEEFIIEYCSLIPKYRSKPKVLGGIVRKELSKILKFESKMVEKDMLGGDWDHADSNMGFGCLCKGSVKRTLCRQFQQCQLNGSKVMKQNGEAWCYGAIPERWLLKTPGPWSPYRRTLNFPSYERAVGMRMRKEDYIDMANRVFPEEFDSAEVLEEFEDYKIIRLLIILYHNPVEDYKDGEVIVF